MEQLSPATRRIVAVGLAVLLILLALQYVVVPLVEAIGNQREELAALRQREARLRATMDRPLPAVSQLRPGQAIVAGSIPQARQRLQALLAGDAAMAGAMLQPGPQCPSGDQRLLCAGISVSGPEAAIARFLSLAEHGPPVVRFRHWQLGPTQVDAGQGPTGQLRYGGQAIAVWRSPS